MRGAPGATLESIHPCVNSLNASHRSSHNPLSSYKSYPECHARMAHAIASVLQPVEVILGGPADKCSNVREIQDRVRSEFSLVEGIDPTLLKCRTGHDFVRYAKRHDARVTNGSKHVQVFKNGFRWTVAGHSSMNATMHRSARKVGMAMFIKMGFGLKD